MYAYDTQLYFSLKINEQDAALDRLETCISQIKDFMFKNHLKLNDAKTEFLVIGNSCMTGQVRCSSIRSGDSNVKVADSAKKYRGYY